MEKIWLKQYPSGIPQEINPDKYLSLVDFFEQSCVKYKENIAFINYGSTMTYGEFEQLSRYLAAYFQQVLKLEKGDRIALMMPNCLQYPVAIFAALRAGLIVVNMNPLYTSFELVHQLNDAECKAIIVLANFAHTLEKALSQIRIKHIIVTELGDLFSPLKGFITNFVVRKIRKLVPEYHLPNVLSLKDFINEGKKIPFQRIDLDRNAIAFLQYTGGTTGISKGAKLTHRNLLANIEQASAWVQFDLQETKETVATPLPLYHIFSLLANFLLFIHLGAKNLLITNPRDIPDFVKQLKRYPISVMIGVNTLFNALLNSENFRSLDFSQLRLSFGGGMSIHESVAKRWKEITGCHITEGYGLTETSPLVTANPLNNDDYTGSIGIPVPSTEIAILDPKGNEVPLGEVGELYVRGPQVMIGYWNQEEETKKALSNEGWLRTGDLVTISETGYVKIVDRIKDMILVSGFNVYPNEIEEVIAAHPGISEVGVVGVEDEHSGEIVQAYIVKKDPNLTADAIIQYAREHLTAYKIPKKIEFVSELPKTTVGKILRRRLRGPENMVDVKAT